MRKIRPYLHRFSRNSRTNNPVLCVDLLYWIPLKLDNKCAKYRQKFRYPPPPQYNTGLIALIFTKISFAQRYYKIFYTELRLIRYKNFGSMGRNSFTSVSEAWEPNLKKLTLARQLFVQNTCIESHENPTNGLVAQPRMYSICVFFTSQCLNMREIRNNNTILVGKHEWNRQHRKPMRKRVNIIKWILWKFGVSVWIRLN